MGLTNFRASDFDGSAPVKNMVHSKRDRLAGPQETTKPLPQAQADPEAVPAGTVPEVMTWVGEDPVRAQKALDEEKKNDRPRKGLVSSLTEMVEKPSNDGTAVSENDGTVESENDGTVDANEDDGQSAVDQPVKADDGTDATEESN
jgi:hypothetical protein